MVSIERTEKSISELRNYSIQKNKNKLRKRNRTSETCNTITEALTLILSATQKERHNRTGLKQYSKI